MPPADLIERELVHSIVGGFYAVYNYYDYGLVESIYSAALAMELKDRGHSIAREVAAAVEYRGRQVGWQRLDLLVDDKVIVEIKATEQLPRFARRQLLSYLHVTAYEVGLLLHFGPQPKFERLVDTSSGHVLAARPLVPGV